MPDGDEKENLLRACNRLEEDNIAVEYARLNVNVYDDCGAPDGWKRLTGEELPPEVRASTLYDSETGLIKDDTTGFHAAIFRSEIDDRYVLVFRGSDDGKDWGITNVPNLKNPIFAVQYHQARNLAGLVNSAYPNRLTITGHSLGGGLASVGGWFANCPTYTFNSASVRWLDISPRASRLIRSYNVDGEILSLSQDWTGLPNAAGVRRSLPPRDGDDQPSPTRGEGSSDGRNLQGFAGLSPDGFGWFEVITRDLTRSFQSMFDFASVPGEVVDTVAAKVTAAAERHRAQQVVDAFEREKQSDIQTIQTMTGVALSRQE